MALKSFKKIINKAKKSDSYWVEQAKLQYSVAFNRLFTNKGVSQQELAANIGTSPAYITKVFRGDSNFTIETMVKLARAVDGELQINITHPTDKNAWSKVQIPTSEQTTSALTNTWLKTLKSKDHERISAKAE